jgi:cardiolipin synthase C
VHSELMMISAYFVPGQPGLVYLTGRAMPGVDVRLLTNSLEATDVPAVHGGYAPYRKALLEHGVKLYELRRQPGDVAAAVARTCWAAARCMARTPACTARR